MQRNQSLSRAARLAAIVSVVLVLGGGLAAAKSIECALGDSCRGTRKADTIQGEGENVIKARGGNDEITSEGGQSDIYGGGGADKILDKFGASVILGEDGRDTITSKGGKSLLDGGSGNDKITDTFGESGIFGRGGNDTIDAKNGRGDDIDCGPGEDTVTFDKELDDVKNCEDERT